MRRRRKGAQKEQIQKVPVTVRFPVTLVERIEVLADGRPMTVMVERLCEEALRERESTSAVGAGHRSAE